MKKSILFLLLFVSLKLTAITPANYVIYMAWLSAPALLGVEYFRYDTEDYLNDGLYGSFGLDPRMAVTEGVDMRLKAFYHIDRLEPVIMFESFPKIDIEFYGVGLNYQLVDRKMGVHAGPEINYVRNDISTNEKNGISVGLNVGVRLVINPRMSIEFETNVKSRPTLTKHTEYVRSVFSNYVHFNYLIISND